MKSLLFTFIFFLSITLSAQDEEVINRINQNAIEIEDADPNKDLPMFNNQILRMFNISELFGFGEASHT